MSTVKMTIFKDMERIVTQEEEEAVVDQISRFGKDFAHQLHVQHTFFLNFSAHGVTQVNLYFWWIFQHLFSFIHFGFDFIFFLNETLSLWYLLLLISYFLSFFNKFKMFFFFISFVFFSAECRHDVERSSGSVYLSVLLLADTQWRIWWTRAQGR